MIPLALAAAGMACLLISALLLRSLGPGYRVGRLLAATPQTSIDEAISLAQAGTVAYVRVAGRITSDEEFPDDQDRPLVFRRTRIQVADSGGWRVVLDDREAVPFGVESRSAYIAVDQAELGIGLVVIPRQADGVVADLPADLAAALPADLDPATPARLIVDQLSAVEHATVCGVPVADGQNAILRSGGGRPLIATSLEPAAAMRVLAGQNRGRVLLAAGLLLLGLAALAIALVATLIGIPG